MWLVVYPWRRRRRDLRVRFTVRCSARTGARTRRRSLMFRRSVLEAYDDNLFATLGSSTVDPRSRQVGGFYSMLQPGIDYHLNRRRVQVGVTGASALGYYPDFHEIKSISHTAGAGLSVQASRKTTIFVNQTAAYSPWELVGLFPTSPEGLPGSRCRTRRIMQPQVWSRTRIARPRPSRLPQAVGRASRSAGTITTRTLRTKRSFNVTRHRRGSTDSFRNQRTRNLALRAGYHYLTGNLGYGGGSVDTNENRLEGGISYSRPLSATRRMNFGLNVGSSAVTSSGAQPELQVPNPAYTVPPRTRRLIIRF